MSRYLVHLRNCDPKISFTYYDSCYLLRGLWFVIMTLNVFLSNTLLKGGYTVQCTAATQNSYEIYKGCV